LFFFQATQGGFGIAISGGATQSASTSLSENNVGQGGGGILVSDVIPSGPAFGLLQVGDRITSCNGYPLEHADYGSAVAVMKEAQQLNMVGRREYFRANTKEIQKAHFSTRKINQIFWLIFFHFYLNFSCFFFFEDCQTSSAGSICGI
jgi:C-terminal processing protease CtpA/Prc